MSLPLWFGSGHAPGRTHGAGALVLTAREEGRATEPANIAPTSDAGRGRIGPDVAYRPEG
jgi:hypothetical protein